MPQTIPILSLLVAMLAVFVGPLISWHVAKKQTTTSLEIANKQIIGPMRQAWINKLRELLAELLGSALHYHVAGFEDRTDAEFRSITLFQYRVLLMLNARESDHQQLEALIEKLVNLIGKNDSSGDKEFEATHKQVVSLTRDVLKREWDRVRQPIA